MDPKKADDLIAIISEEDAIQTVEKVTQNYRGGGYLVGRLILVLKEGAVPGELVEKLRPVMDQMMPYGYDIDTGVFIKPRPTVSDYLRHAEGKQ
jgi:hypothetical protein